MIELAIVLVAGVALGYMFGARGKVSRPAPDSELRPETAWWDLRDALTGTQLQILQYLEAEREVSITAVQEKFSFIPDRELYYRLEQISLMGFIKRDRKHGEVIYTLNPDYALKIENDSTVIVPEK